jgi:hypothetical protein
MRLAHIIIALAAVPIAVTATSARADDDKDRDKNKADDWEDDTTIIPQPILPAEAARREGPSARQWFDTAVTYTHIGAPMREADVEAVSLQLALGPKPVTANTERVFGNVLSWFDDYSLRLRWTHVMMHDGSTREAPLTVAVQRFLVAKPLEAAPLLHLHLGIESAFATPWLGDRKSAPPMAYQKLYAVDTELAHNGYSVRPLGLYVRGDVFFCRNIFLEAGIAPELFLPTEGGDRPNEYDLRWHASFGWNFACSSDPVSWRRPLAVSFEVRGRSVLSVNDDPQRRALDSVAVQYHLGESWVINVFGSRATGVPLSQYYAAGVRLQVGLGERTEKP